MTPSFERKNRIFREYDLRYRGSMPNSNDVLKYALQNATEYLGGLGTRPVNARADVSELRALLDRPLQNEELDPEHVVRELAKDVAGGLVGSASGRFFGWVIGGSLPAALAADWLTSTWDQNAALYSCSPAAAIVEEVCGTWLKDILDLPRGASFALVTGCQMAHATCLAAARHALLQRRGWDVEQNGLFGAPPIRILSSNLRHGSIARAVRFLGLGESYVHDVATENTGSLSYEALDAALQEHSPYPTIVVLQAGDIATGAFDDFTQLVPLAKSRGAWVHVDGAFGLWAAASPKFRHLVKGVDAADSWATDGHKWLNIPFDSGFAFVANAEAHRASLAHRASYLTHAAEARDQINWTPEWSRRARGFPAYAALRQLGRHGVADLIERCCAHACSIVQQIGELPGAEVVSAPIINQGLIRFLDESKNAIQEDHDRRTDEIIAAIVASGEAFFTGTTWRGRRAMRVSVCNWRTSEDDVRRTVEAFSRILNVPQFAI